MKRLDEISVARQTLARDPSQKAADLHMAVMVDAAGKLTGPRETLGMTIDGDSRRIAPNDSGRSLVGFVARVGTEPNCRLDVSVEIVDKQLDVSMTNPVPSAGIPTARDTPDKTTVRFTLGHSSSASRCLAGRLYAAKLWSLIGADTAVSSVPATLDGIVLGTRLRRNDAPASFSDPGAGAWTLLRVLVPGDAYIAIDWEHGALELFPKDVGVRTPAGDAIFSAF